MRLVRRLLAVFNILLILAGLSLIYFLAEDYQLKAVLTGVVLVSAVLNLGYYICFRSMFVRFSDKVCRCTEDILRGRRIESCHNQESLTSKMVTELEKVEDVFQYRLRENEKEKQELQEMISEITHQLKTPIANIRMYQEMFSEPDITSEEARDFMTIMQKQLGKLEFLIDALIKSSRLESDMIRLEPDNSKIVQTLAVAVNSVIQKAELKKIEVSVNCRPAIQLIHDAKWTAEALENILDNAVKYTPENGRIAITVSTGEMYTEIKIKDTGKGIEAGHVNDIFKRFYREKSVSRTEGLGLGLYLARKIITLQGGYITVHSAVGKGSCFSVFLPNRMYA